jgi:hypothetical protein
VVTGTRYYLYQDNQVVGPHTPAEIAAMGLDPATYVCVEGAEEWLALSQVPELLVPPTSANVIASPIISTSNIEITEKKKIFIIHGRGNTMDDALGRLISLVLVKFRYYQAGFYVDADNSNFARYVLYDSHTNPYTALFDRILTGKLILAPLYPPPGDWRPDATWTKLSDFKIPTKLETYGAPIGASGKKKEWADNFFQAVWTDAARLFGVPITSQPGLAMALTELRTGLRPAEGGLCIERELKENIRARFAPLGIDPEAFIAFLVEFQRLGDAGGDLDTIASNALYGAWIMQAWEAKYGRSPRYGRDYEFDFVNYHQSFLHLARHKNCEIYLPDFPMDAIPDLEEAARALIETGSFLVRVDDHHPMSQEKLDLLARLKNEGLIGDFVMSGPLKGAEEQPREERTCGADLVYKAMLEKTGFATPGLDELRRLAHQQDLHFVADPDDRTHPDYMAIDLSKLIGSKHSRIDMAQQLAFVRTHEEMRAIMETTGWRGIVDDYEKALEEVLPKLDPCVARIEFLDPKDVERRRGSLGWISKLGKILRAITFGKVDIELKAIRKRHPDDVHRILMTLGPFQTRKEHRINIASALNYLKRYHRYDYFFYAWGSSLLSTRRFNEEDQALDLSVLMPIIGGPGDGGHSSAATCKPPSNAAWPSERFERLKKSNFLDYAKYIGGRIAKGTGMQIVHVMMLEERDRDFPDGLGAPKK